MLGFKIEVPILTFLFSLWGNGSTEKGKQGYVKLMSDAQLQGEYHT